MGLDSSNRDCHLREGWGELEAADPKGKRGRYRSSVLFPPKIRLYTMGVSTALEEISKLALNSSVWTPATAGKSCQHVGKVFGQPILSQLCVLVALWSTCTPLLVWSAHHELGCDHPGYLSSRTEQNSGMSESMRGAFRPCPCWGTAWMSERGWVQAIWRSVVGTTTKMSTPCGFWGIPYLSRFRPCLPCLHPTFTQVQLLLNGPKTFIYSFLYLALVVCVSSPL